MNIWEVSGVREVHVSCTLNLVAPDYQGFSLAFTRLLLPLVAEFLLLIRDYNGFSVDLPVMSAGN
jgi:hypothetical protein